MILNGDPLANVSNLLNVVMVIKGGDIVIDKRQSGASEMLIHLRSW